jgi:hypothetical protein
MRQGDRKRRQATDFGLEMVPRCYPTVELRLDALRLLVRWAALPQRSQAPHPREKGSSYLSTCAVGAGDCRNEMAPSTGASSPPANPKGSPPCAS